jgi:signal peptidase
MTLTLTTLTTRATAVAFVAVLGASLLFSAPGLVGAEYGYVVVSGSMAPHIDPGDAILVDARPATAVRVGDVITYVPAGASRSSDSRVTHRVVAVHDRPEGRFFETKGDANEDSDPALVAGDQVVGVVTLRLPLLGYLVVFAGTTTGRIALVSVPLAALAVLEARTLLRAARPRDAPARRAEK